MFEIERSGAACQPKEGCCDDSWDMWNTLGEEHTGPVNPHIEMSPWGDAVVHLSFGVSLGKIMCGTASMWCGAESFNHASCQGLRILLNGYYEPSEGEGGGEVEGMPVLMATKFRLDMAKCEIVIEQEPSVII